VIALTIDEDGMALNGGEEGCDRAPDFSILATKESMGWGTDQGSFGIF